jgi:hypothetical protein
MMVGRFLKMAAVLGVWPIAAAAQSSSGTLVVTMAGQAAEGGTRVHVLITTLDSIPHLVRADSGTKELSFAALAAGRYRVETRSIGFTPDTAFVQVRDGRDANVTVNLKRAVTDLAPITVAGSTGHLTAFEKRRAQGKGTFLTAEELRKEKRSQVSEALRSVRGLRVDCGGGCRVHMVRSTTCEPRYFMNGFPSDAGILMTPLLDVAGIEIYRGPSETPGEFMGAQSMCGAIVIWTK